MSDLPFRTNPEADARKQKEQTCMTMGGPGLGRNVGADYGAQNSPMTVGALEGKQIVYTIAGDIGGTNSRLALYQTDLSKSEEEGDVLFNLKYQNDQFDSFSEVLSKFFADAEEATGIPSASYYSGAFAIAGPVFNNKVKFTNLEDWPEVDGAALGEKFGMKIEIINDFVGLSQGLVTLTDEDVKVIHKGEVIERGVKACIGAGTGLGEAYLTYNTELGQYEAWPSEGGHSDFVPRTSQQLEMAQWIRAKIYPEKVCCDLGARISVERICSGGGLMNTYEFLRHNSPEEIDEETDRLYEKAGPKEKPALITEYGVRNMDSLMGQTLRIFLATLGTEIANMALKFIPYGGIYIAGGIVPKLVTRAMQTPEACDIKDPKSCEGAILSGFEVYKTLKRDARNKGRMGFLLDRIPVYLVVGEKIDTIAISGAQFVAKRLAARHRNKGGSNSESSSPPSAKKEKAHY